MMKQPAIVLMLCFLSAIFIGSCTNAKEELQPGSGCDTLNMSYSINIVPILSYNCYSCHGLGNSVGGDGIILEGYNNLHPYTTGGMNSILVGVITHQPGLPAMPYMKDQLDSCSINQITAWVNQGAKDN
jgi:hypothetical protein